MLSFRIKAVSDEERSAMISIVINPSNGAFADHLVEPILDLLSVAFSKEKRWWRNLSRLGWRRAFAAKDGRN